MASLLAIDPGTYQTGLAFFTDGQLVDYKLIRALPSGFVDFRIQYIVAECWAAVLDQEITEIACERATGYEDARPASSVQTLIQSLRARAKKAKIPFTTYHPSTVVAAVRPRGFTERRHTNKQVISMGVMMLYGLAIPDLFDVEQDVLDAIAVGVCHLNKQKEKEVLSHGYGPAN